MKNIPVYATEFGVGSLILKDVPYTQTAYVRIESASSPKEFLEECISFCRVVGAEKIFATGHEVLEDYPLHTTICRMRCDCSVIPTSDANVFPVTEKTLNRWLEIYRGKMRNVANAAYMTDADGREMLKRGDGYFIHRDGELIGIGIANSNVIDLVASVTPGGGKEIVSALSHALCDEEVTLDVASTNEKAIRLYESLGFIKTQELSNWYKIF